MKKAITLLPFLLVATFVLSQGKNEFGLIFKAGNSQCIISCKSPFFQCNIFQNNSFINSSSPVFVVSVSTPLERRSYSFNRPMMCTVCAGL